MTSRAMIVLISLLSAVSGGSGAEVPPELRTAMQQRLEAVWTKDAARQGQSEAPCGARRA